ncbi:MAG: nucleoside 2-deoxyribosyltransferase [Dictyoglomus sp. NZ13-RE01]|nr:MAG: nucleoside 2-deoxyribosyltransferase [Dictyoglomus sp. NZ13-RE01]
MKIYFAGAIRGGRENQEIFERIIKFLKEKGLIVLTEHVGYKNVLEVESNFTPEEIYERDMRFLKECDLLIAEVSTPSLGVGYEIAKAEDMGKDIICFCKSNIPLSALILGNKNLKLYFYDSIEDIFNILDKYIRG